MKVRRQSEHPCAHLGHVLRTGAWFDARPRIEFLVRSTSVFSSRMLLAFDASSVPPHIMHTRVPYSNGEEKRAPPVFSKSHPRGDSQCPARPFWRLRTHS